MVYTEIKERNGNKYFYRVLSVRKKDKISKERVYMGKNLSKEELDEKETGANKKIYAIKRELRGKEFETLKKRIIKLLKEKGIKKAGIFGSYARGDQKKNSDIDIIIEPSKKTSGFNFFGFQNEISEKLKKKVDLVTYEGINHLIRERILNQEIKII